MTTPSFNEEMCSKKIEMMRKTYFNDKDFCAACSHAGRIFFIDRDKEVNQRYCECFIKLINKKNEPRLLLLGRIPSISLEFSIDNYQNTGTNDIECASNNQSISKIKSIKENFKDHWRSAANIFIPGHSGTGKTVIACDILKRAISLGYSSAYVDYLSYTTLSQRFDISEEDNDWRNYVLGCGLLLIDNVDRVQEKDIQKVYILETLLRQRIQSRLCNIYVSSVPRDELETRVGFSCASLMRERTITIPFVGRDFRRAPK